MWSADSRYLAWSRPVTGTNWAVFVYDTKDAARHQVTSAYFNDQAPTFDPEGKYLYYESDRTFAPVYGDFDNSWTYANPTRLVAVPLRADVPSPSRRAMTWRSGKKARATARRARRARGASRPNRPRLSRSTSTASSRAP